MPTTVDLFSPVRVGEMELKNRFVMAPLTRCRAGIGHVPTALNAIYYAQRASAGLIITEGAAPDPLGRGYIDIPGLYNAEQVAGWRRVTDAVHAHSAKIFVQLMYVGRVAHPSSIDGETPVAPSAVKAQGEVFTKQGLQPFVMPRALAAEEIPGIIATYRRAAEFAITAGFDGVELHATSGYLPAQFLSPNTNLRTDEWGGTLEKRARFLLEVVDAMASVRGPQHVGVRIGPGFTYNDIHDPNPLETYSYIAKVLSPRNLAYLHVLDDPDEQPGFDVIGALRRQYRGILIANGGYDKARANRDIDSGRADLVSFGVLFIANPDLPERFRRNAPLNEPDEATFYTPGEKGYTDYPFLDEG